MSVTTQLEKHRVLLDATIAARNAKILRIFCENPYTEKIFAAALRGLSEGPPGGGTQGRSSPIGVATPFAMEPLPMVASEEKS